MSGTAWPWELSGECDRVLALSNTSLNPSLVGLLLWVTSLLRSLLIHTDLLLRE